MKATPGVIIALDVGGTTISSAAVFAADVSILGSAHTIAGNNNAAKDEILQTISEAIRQARVDAGETPAIACAVAFPGPFDYAHGISRMDHKFQAIEGFDLRAWLRDMYGLPSFFLNDADSFGYGVLARRFSAPPKRLLSITLGTGVGSAYFIDGVLQDLEIWNMPYRDGILEDDVSSRAIAGLYTKKTGETLSVKEQARRAFEGDGTARDVFRTFGVQLGTGLAAVISDLHPTAIVIGGAIAQSAELFKREAEEVYREHTSHKVTFDWEADEHTALYGAAVFGRQELAR